MADAQPRIRYRLRQDGMVVAWAEGPTALDELIHYARVYGQDGPVFVEHYYRRKWRTLAKRMPW